jgi:hypothetical protein
MRPVRDRLSLVAPARNKARDLALVLESIPERIDDVELVDGSSRNATVAMAVHCRPDIRVVPQGAPGKKAALRAGFEAATGDMTVMLDADGSMFPLEIPHFLWYLHHGFDFVKASRFVAGGGSADITCVRRLGNRSLLSLVNVLYEAHLTNLWYGFWVLQPRSSGGWLRDRDGNGHPCSASSPSHRRGTQLRVAASQLATRGCGHLGTAGGCWTPLCGTGLAVGNATGPRPQRRDRGPVRACDRRCPRARHVASRRGRGAGGGHRHRDHRTPPWRAGTR